jgi:hypothetical protein
MQYFYKDVSRDDKIANDRWIINIIKIIKQVMTTLVTTYLLALLWYRFSDRWQYLLGETDDSQFFVVVFGLRPHSYTVPGDSVWALNGTESIDKAQRMLYSDADWNMPVDEDSRLSDVHVRLFTCMYYALTTLSTVGYGDYYPCSISEKIVGSVIQIFGVTFFSILMNNFIDVVLSMRTSNFNDNEDQLQNWFIMIKKIRNQPDSGTLDIPISLRDRIEFHFRYFWDNDRTAVLQKRKDFFDQIPFRIQHHILTKFLFQDIFTMSAFKSFFRTGINFDSNFLYEIAFGFMPRQFKATPEERYIFEEEVDVTEIYFIIKGEYAIGFNSYYRWTE